MREEEEKEGGEKGGGEGDVGVHREGKGEGHKAGVAVDVVAPPTQEIHLMMVS